MQSNRGIALARSSPTCGRKWSAPARRQGELTARTEKPTKLKPTRIQMKHVAKLVLESPGRCAELPLRRGPLAKEVQSQAEHHSPTVAGPRVSFEKPGGPAPT